MQPTTNMLSYSVPHRFCGRQMCTTCGSSVHTGSEMAACSSSSRLFAVSSPTMSAATASNSLMPSAPMAFMRPNPRRVAFFSRKSWPERHFSASVRARRNGSFAPKPALPTWLERLVQREALRLGESCRPIQASEFVSALSKPHQLRHAIMSVGSASSSSFVYATSARERVESRGSPQACRRRRRQTR